MPAAFRKEPARPPAAPARPGTATINDLPQPARDTRRGLPAAGIGTASPLPVPPAGPGRCPLYVRAQPETAGFRWTQRDLTGPETTARKPGKPQATGRFRR